MQDKYSWLKNLEATEFIVGLGQTTVKLKDFPQVIDKIIKALEIAELEGRIKGLRAIDDEYQVDSQDLMRDGFSHPVVPTQKINEEIKTLELELKNISGGGGKT